MIIDVAPKDTLALNTPDNIRGMSAITVRHAAPINTT
jgi:hypothetical protein